MLETLVRFRLTGEFEPDAITQALGLQPTQTWRKDELVPKTIIRRESDGWLIDSGMGKNAWLNEQVTALFKKLEPSWSALEKICSHTQADLSCVIYTSGDRPGIWFEADTVRRLASLNAFIDVDLYVLPGEDDQNL
jgi:hypothetical protein